MDDFLHYRTSRQNELRSITLHIAILANKRRNNGKENSENEVYNDFQKVIDQKVISTHNNSIKYYNSRYIIQTLKTPQCL